MKALVKCLVTGTFAALAMAVAAPPAAAENGDEMAGFYVADKLRVGDVELKPAIYIVRVLHSDVGRNVLLVTDVEGTKVFAALLATGHEIAEDQIATTSRLLYEAADGSRPASLRTFLVAHSPYGYDIVSPKMAPNGAMGTIAAIQ